MSRTVTRIVLWLFVLNLGLALGAGLYESRIVVSRWIVSSPESATRWDAEAAREDDTGRRFWAFVTTVPLTLLTVASLIAAWRTVGPVRGWWLGAALLALADRIFTFSYFIPSMLRLTRAADSPAAVAAATQWAQLNHLRHAILLAAWLVALKAFAVSYERG